MATRRLSHCVRGTKRRRGTVLLRGGGRPRPDPSTSSAGWHKQRRTGTSIPSAVRSDSIRWRKSCRSKVIASTSTSTRRVTQWPPHDRGYVQIAATPARGTPRFHALLDEGLRLARNTIRRLCPCGHLRRAPGRTMDRPDQHPRPLHKPQLHQRWAEACTGAHCLFEEVRASG